MVQAKILEETLASHFLPGQEERKFGVGIISGEGEILDGTTEFCKHLSSRNTTDLFLFLNEAGLGYVVREMQWFFTQELPRERIDFVFPLGDQEVKLCLMRLETLSGTFVGISSFESERMDVDLIHIKQGYEVFLDNSFDLSFQMDDFDRIVLCNANFLKKLGYSTCEEVSRMLFDELFVTNYKLLKNRIMKKGSIKRLPIALQKKDGGVMYGLLNGKTFQAENKGWHFNWTFLEQTDLSSGRSHCSNDYNELDKVNLEMERFLYRASHDLRSPIASIGGLMNLIKMEQVNDTVAKYVKDIDKSVQKLENAIRGIVGFSKTKYKNVNSQRIDFSVLLHKVIADQKDYSGIDNIRFDLKLNNGVVFHNDYDRIEIILNHLIRNAIDFRDPWKDVICIKVAIMVDEEQAVMEITDNGLGVSPEHVPHIFDMFYRASEASQGPGLGLYVVREGLEHMRGKISVFSKTGVGTTFKIVIPNRAPLLS